MLLIFNIYKALQQLVFTHQPLPTGNVPMRTMVWLLAAVAAGTSCTLLASEDYWNTSERLNRRTCPSADCGVVGHLMFREKAVVHEQQNGWARISKYYNAGCEDGNSPYVDSGDSSCIEENGIEDGKFAEWVSMSYLSRNRPEDPADSATASESLVSGSDDFARYRVVFAESASAAIEKGICKEQDFVDMGGWLKSTNEPDRPVYFTYCGSKKLYLDVSTGKLY